MAHPVTIRKVHDRKVKSTGDHFKRFFIEQGLKCWYVCVNKGIVTALRERTYFDETKDDCSEKRIDYLPNNINELLNEHL